jgi:hypothetical protein
MPVLARGFARIHLSWREIWARSAPRNDGVTVGLLVPIGEADQISRRFVIVFNQFSDRCKA